MVSRTVWYVGIDHRRLQVAMTEQQLNGPNIHPLGQQVCGKRMPQRMNTGMLAHAGLLQRPLERLLDERLGNVPAQEPARQRAAAHNRDHCGHLACTTRPPEEDAAGEAASALPKAGWFGLGALAAPDREGLRREIEIRHAKRHTLCDTQFCARALPPRAGAVQAGFKWNSV